MIAAAVMSILDGKTARHEILRLRAIQQMLAGRKRHPDDYFNASDYSTLDWLHERVIAFGGYCGLDPLLALPLIAMLMSHCVVCYDERRGYHLVIRVTIPEGVTSEQLQDHLDMLHGDEKIRRD